MSTSQRLKVTAQWARHTHEESELLGLLEPDAVIQAHDRIDWQDQAGQADTLRKVAPTFAVERGSEVLWVSVAGQPPDISFVASYAAPGRVKRLFGLLASDGIVERHRTDMTPDESRQAVVAFVGQDRATLDRLFPD